MYDAWMERVGTVELAGKTLRESLTKLMKSRSYKIAPDGFEGSGTGTKLHMVRSLVSDYRKAARESIPELRDMRALAKRAQEQRARSQFKRNLELFPNRELNERSMATKGRELFDF